MLKDMAICGTLTRCRYGAVRVAMTFPSIRSEDEFMYLAPDSGYQSNYHITMNSNEFDEFRLESGT